MRSLARRLVKYGHAVQGYGLQLFHHAMLWVGTRGPLSPIRQLAKLNGLELAAHLNERAFVRAFPVNQRIFYVMVACPGTALLLTMATAVAMPGLWYPGSGLVSVVWAALFWRLVILRKQRRALRGVLLECGHCPSCGYDLRASGHRCPECGTVPEVPT